MMMKRMTGKANKSTALFVKLNREYISGWKNKSIRFYYWKMEVDIYAEHKSIRND